MSLSPDTPKAEEPRKITLDPRRCAQCRESWQVMVTMMPGHDGAAWWLCVKCYKHGLRTKEEQAAIDAKIAALT